MATWEVIQGDCLDVLRSMPDASVDAIVTDPPYGLSFMGKCWDYDVPAVEVWAECLRVLKPGGHLLAFAGTRTQHRMAVRIEDAGFEIRDMIAWVYGSGFPKSMDVSKAIDAHIRCGGSNTKRLRQTEQETGGEGYELRGKNNGILGESKTWDRKEWSPVTPQAKAWSGWGTALKPALEPITMARKPFESTVAANVQEWGTGAINVDGCRVGTEEVERGRTGRVSDQFSTNAYANGNGYAGRNAEGGVSIGRWPANLIHDGSDEVLAGFPSDGDKSAARFFYCPKASKAERDAGCEGMDVRQTVGGGGTNDPNGDDVCGKYGSVKSPARNHHPTVKPAALMAYLCRLVTPPGGTILDPFNGSGSTGIGAIREGFNYIGIEREAEYVEIARKRIGHEAANHLFTGAHP